MKKLILTFSLSALAVGTALAQASFETVDADSDGAITLEEASNAGLSWTETQFTLADKDGDGSLNADEFAEAIQ